MSRTRQPESEGQTAAGEMAWSRDADAVLRRVRGDQPQEATARRQHDPLAGVNLENIPADELARIADKINAIQKAKKK